MRASSAGPASPRLTRRFVLDGVRRDLELAGVEDAGLEAQRLLCHLLQLPRHELALTGADALLPSQAKELAQLLERRLAGVPLQYVEGVAAFRNLDLLCDARALIPRPETEQLLDCVLAWCGGSVVPYRPRSIAGSVTVVPRPVTPTGNSGSERSIRAGPRVRCALDIGTGSGAIALSLLSEGAAERMVAIDTSSEALSLAAENAQRLGLTDRLDLRLTGPGVWSAVRPEEQFDLIVSNPPYVTERQWAEGVASEIRDHEPREALCGGTDGLDVIRAIVAGAPLHLRSGGRIFLEVGSGHGPSVRTMLDADPVWVCAEVRRDLAGHDRFAIAERS